MAKANPMMITIAVAVIAFIAGFVLSYLMFNPMLATNQPSCDNQQTTSGTQQTTQTTVQTTVFDLQIPKLEVFNPSLGRGNTLVFSGTINDQSFNSVGAVEINATLTNNSNKVIVGGTFTSVANGTFEGRLNVPYTLGYLGDYILNVQAHLNNRWTPVKTTKIAITN